MSIRLPSVLLGALLLSGCARHRAESPSPATASPSGATNPAASSQKLIVTPETGLAGKVVSVSAAGRFVVLNFPIGHLPAIDQRLNVYHLGLKVGEVKISGPQRDDDIVADLVAGEATEGDRVRDH